MNDDCDNIQYWVNIDGVQSGPMPRGELTAAGLTPDSYVWRAGLDDWVRAGDLDELADLLRRVPPPVPVEACRPQVPAWQSAYQRPQPQCPVVEPCQPPKPNQEPCPSTNLVWAILATVLCCWPFGVVAIVHAAQVRLNYRTGNIAAAKKHSERAALWCILSIVVGAVGIPICFALSLF